MPFKRKYGKRKSYGRKKRSFRGRKRGQFWWFNTGDSHSLNPTSRPEKRRRYDAHDDSDEQGNFRWSTMVNSHRLESTMVAKYTSMLKDMQANQYKYHETWYGKLGNTEAGLMAGIGTFTLASQLYKDVLEYTTKVSKNASVELKTWNDLVTQHGGNVETATATFALLGLAAPGAMLTIKAQLATWVTYLPKVAALAALAWIAQSSGAAGWLQMKWTDLMDTINATQVPPTSSSTTSPPTSTRPVPNPTDPKPKSYGNRKADGGVYIDGVFYPDKKKQDL